MKLLESNVDKKALRIIQTHVLERNKKRYSIDAKEQTIRRLSSQVASMLGGKSQIDYSPSSNPNTNEIIYNKNISKLLAIEKVKNISYTFRSTRQLKDGSI